MRPPGEEGASSPLPLWPGAAVALAVACVYLAVASGGTFRFRQSSFPHHLLIADGWLHGQTYVRDEVIAERSERFYRERRAQAEKDLAARGYTLTDEMWENARVRLRPPIRLDWVEYRGHLYGYWGPMAAALLLPWVLLGGIDVSDVLFSCLIGSATVFLTYVMLREARRAGLLETTAAAAAALAVLVGLGTVHFYLAVLGQVWFLAQVVEMLFFTLAVCCLCRSARGALWSMAAGFAFAASILARLSVVATLPFFLAALLFQVPRRSLARHLASFALPLVIAALITFAFDQARFGDAFETGQGLSVQTGGNPALRSEFEIHGRFSIHYVGRNLYYYFVNPFLRRHPSTQALTFDPNGNSLFLVSPALVYALAALRRRDGLVLAAWLGVGASLAGLMIFYATGWYQFGNRYVLDCLPLLILLAAKGMGERLTPAAAVLIALSVAVNSWGTYRFLQEQF